MKNKDFSNFVWGVAHSAFQVEGDPAPSDWLEWTQTPQKIKDGTSANLATQFWKFPDRDFAFAKELGCQAFRFSLAWERIQPEENRFDESAVNRYADMVLKLQNLGMKALPTLLHFALPLWLSKKGGLCSEEFSKHFKSYTEFVLKSFVKKNVSLDWILTHNEPMVQAHMGYMQGLWPPGLKESPEECLKAVRNLIVSHIESADVIRQFYPQSQISIAKHYRPFRPKNLAPWNYPLAKMIYSIFNHQFIRACQTGHIKLWMPGARSINEVRPLPKSKSTLDFLGINFYSESFVSLILQKPFFKIEEGKGIKSDLGWEVSAPSFERALIQAHEDYMLPLMITENGMADRDDKIRPQMVKDFCQVIHKLKNKIPLMGYFHWSLTDNFEWAEGLSHHFGLIAVDYKNQIFSKRKSFEEYKKIIRQLH